MITLKRIIKQAIIDEITRQVDGNPDSYANLEANSLGEAFIDAYLKIDGLAEVILRRLQDVEFVGWVEPRNEKGDPVYWLETVEDVIQQRKDYAAKNGFSYINDEEALIDFIVVHWGNRRTYLWSAEKSKELREQGREDRPSEVIGPGDVRTGTTPLEGDGSIGGRDSSGEGTSEA